MPEADFLYDAFISYRHVEPDREWAKWLHRSLETFRTPRPLVERGAPARLQRVFRDEEELPASADLSTEIETALDRSRYLIVVCSPRTPASAWVNQEVVRFREMGRHDRILALLIEGTPAESFPPSLREIRTEITDDQGLTTEQVEEVEPLAADVRPSRGESPGILKRMALLRFLAVLLGCRFDDLRRREAERQRRRAVGIVVALSVLVAAFAGITALALSESGRARRERARADHEAADAGRLLQEGQVLGLTMASREALERDPTLALLLGREAYRRQATAESYGALAQALYSHHLVAQMSAHDGEITALGFSPDGTRFFSACDEGELRLYDRTAHLRARMRHPDAVVSAEFSPRGDLLATCCRDGLARIWTREGEIVRSLPILPEGGQGEDLWAITMWKAAHGGWYGVRWRGGARFSADGQRILTWGVSNALAGGGVAHVRLWTLEGDLLGDAMLSSLADAALAPDGALFATAGEEESLLWSENGDVVARLGGHEDAVQAVAFSPDGTRLLTASADGRVRTWNREGALLETIGHDSEVLSAAFIPGSTCVLTGAQDGATRIWDVDGRLVAEVSPSPYPVGRIAFSPRGELFIPVMARLTLDAVPPPSTVMAFDLEGRRVAHLVGHGREAYEAAISPDASMALTGSWDGSVCLWNVRAGTGRRLLLPGPGRSIEFSPDGERFLAWSTRHVGTAGGVLVGSRDGRELGGWATDAQPRFVDGETVGEITRAGELRIRDLRGGVLSSVELDGADGYRLTLRSRGRVRGRRGDPRALKLWARNGQVLYDSTRTGDRPFDISPDGDWLLLPDPDNGCRLVQRSSGEVRHLRPLDGRTSRAGFDATGRALFTVQDTGAVSIWNLAGERLGPTRHHEEFAYAVRLSSDGGEALTADGAGIWRYFKPPVPSHEPIELPRLVTSLAFAPNGRGLVVGGSDGTIRFVTPLGVETSRFQAHRSPVTAITISEDAEVLVSTSEDGEVRVWPLQGKRLMSLADEALPRGFTASERQRYRTLLETPSRGR